MRKVTTIFGFIVVVLLITGCGDEDKCPVCPSEAPADRILVSGQVTFLQDLRLSLSAEIISTVGSLRPQIDSMTVMGQPVGLTMEYIQDPPLLYARALIEEPSGAAGDTISVHAYTPFGLSSNRLVLFDGRTDTLCFPGWADGYPWDTVDIGAEVEVAWNSLPAAHGYRYSVQHVYDSTGWNVTSYDGYVEDTVLTITAEENGYNGWWSVYVYAANGLSPDGGTPNVSGSSAVKWKLVSITPGKELTIYVGTGEAGGDIRALWKLSAFGPNVHTAVDTEDMPPDGRQHNGRGEP